MDIQARLDEIRDRVGAACARSGRDASSVQLVAVSKTRTVEEIQAAIRAGVTDVGENKVQEAEAKRAELGDAVTWHLIGHLQKNKAKKAAATFDVIHSIDSASLGERLNRLVDELELDRKLSVFAQVDLGLEETKSGVPANELWPVLEALLGCDRLTVEGLMTLPPFESDPEVVRPYFAQLRRLSEQARERGLAGAELSMGMSHDFEVAIEEGATLVRIGTAIFGPRPTKLEGASAGTIAS